MAKNEAPDVGDEIEFDNAPDSAISVRKVWADQPLAKDGIFLFDDQYGDTKLCERDGKRWTVVMDSDLSSEQQDAVFDLLYPDSDDAPSM